MCFYRWCLRPVAGSVHDERCWALMCGMAFGSTYMVPGAHGHGYRHVHMHGYMRICMAMCACPHM